MRPERRELPQTLDHPAHPEVRPTTLVADNSDFGRWLRTQQPRKDRVGALARVAIQDTTWPGGDEIEVLRRYFREMGAREFVMNSLNQAWSEFTRIKSRESKKQRTRARNRAARAARRQHRR